MLTVASMTQVKSHDDSEKIYKRTTNHDNASYSGCLALAGFLEVQGASRWFCPSANEDLNISTERQLSL